MTIKLSLGYDTERPYGKWAETPEGDAFREKQIAFVREMSQFLNSEHVPRTHFILGNYLDCCQRTFTQKELREIYTEDNQLMEIQQHSYSHRQRQPDANTPRNAQRHKPGAVR